MFLLFVNSWILINIDYCFVSVFLEDITKYIHNLGGIFSKLKILFVFGVEARTYNNQKYFLMINSFPNLKFIELNMIFRLIKL